MDKILVTRPQSKQPCKQYEFNTQDEFNKFINRKPYSREILRVFVLKKIAVTETGCEAYEQERDYHIGPKI